MTNRTIKQHIEDDRNELDIPTTSCQRRRHLEGELEALAEYQKNHPEDEHDPSPLELYCDTHPDALECRVYDD
jgi:hypothetical protein